MLFSQSDEHYSRLKILTSDFLLSFCVCRLELRAIAGHAEMMTSFEWFSEIVEHRPDLLEFGFRRLEV